jgi:hypothetical protein
MLFHAQRRYAHLLGTRLFLREMGTDWHVSFSESSAVLTIPSVAHCSSLVPPIQGVYPWVDFQLEAQSSYLFIYLFIIRLLKSSIIHLLKSSTCFEHCPAHLQEVYVVIVYMQPLVSSLSAGDCPMHRLRKNYIIEDFNRCIVVGTIPSNTPFIFLIPYTRLHVSARLGHRKAFIVVLT